VLLRRVVPLALVVTLLLALVAVAARGRPLGRGAGSGGGLPFSFWDYTFTAVVILAVPALLAIVVAALIVRPEAGQRPSLRRRLLRAVVLFALLAFFEFFVLRHLERSHFRLHVPTPQEPQTGPLAHSGHHRAATTRSLHFRWDELAIVLGLLLVAGVIAAARRTRPGAKRAFESAPETLAAALDESLDDLRADPDLRRSIVAAYARMERALAAAGVPRRPAEAPLEFLERTLLSLDASAEAVRRLTDLFEWARFSQHEPDPSMRDDAVDALVAVRDELRASELTPA
jgi:hypothetical protein